jgi:hypothetical protein
MNGRFVHATFKQFVDRTRRVRRRLLDGRALY